MPRGFDGEAPLYSDRYGLPWPPVERQQKKKRNQSKQPDNRQQRSTIRIVGGRVPDMGPSEIPLKHGARDIEAIVQQAQPECFVGFIAAGV